MCFILALVVSLIVTYHIMRKKVSEQLPSNFFNTVFVFIVCWIVSRIVYYTDYFHNYSYDMLAILATLPNILTYITIAIAIYNA